MTRKLLIAALGCVACVSSSFAAPAAAADQEQQQLLAAVKELQQQQAQIADNQAKIDAKVAELAEIIRQARIFASRGGGGR